MSDPVRVPAAQPGPRFRVPEDAVPVEERALLERDDSVDPDAAIAWLEGRGPDPWQRAGSD